MIRELIPSDLAKLQSTNDWKRAIVGAYNTDAGKFNISTKFASLKLNKIQHFQE
jgi:myosin-7